MSLVAAKGVNMFVRNGIDIHIAGHAIAPWYDIML